MPGGTARCVVTPTTALHGAGCRPRGGQPRHGAPQTEGWQGAPPGQRVLEGKGETVRL